MKMKIQRDHPSVTRIKEKSFKKHIFSFKPVTFDSATNLIRDMPNKETLCGDISRKSNNIHSKSDKHPQAIWICINN